MCSAYVITSLDVTAVDRVEHLWHSMVEHHRGVPGNEWPVKSAADAWTVRRAEYVDWLTRGVGWLLAAVPAGDPDDSPDGYAAVKVLVPGATWELGEQMGELESLAVADHARGTGLGTQLIEASRALLRERGVEFWSVAFVEANEGAARLYERSGFRPYYRTFLGRVDEPR